MKCIKLLFFLTMLLVINFIYNVVFSRYYGCLNFGVFAFSTIILLILCGIFTAIFKKTNRAINILTCVFLIITFINYLKMNFLGEPIWLTDIYMTNNLAEIVDLVKYDILTWDLLKYSFILIIILANIVILAKITNIDVNSKKQRISLFLVSVILLIFTLAPLNIKNEWLLKNIYQVENRTDSKLNIMGIGYYQDYGIIGGLYGQMLESRIKEPLGYNEENVEKVLNSLKVKNDKSLGKPNIILMFAESFWEVDKIEEVEFDRKITQNFNRLKEKGISLELITPSYGGASANVEFEVLTGGNMRYFKNGYIPFIHLYRKKSSNELLSIVNELSNNNYKTKMMFGNDVYFSKTSYLNLGIDEYINLKRDYDKYWEFIKGHHLSDEKMVDFLIEEFEKKKPGERIFYSMATIASHGPFTVDKYEEYVFDIFKSKFEEEDALRLKTYAQGIYDLDEQILRIYEYIQNYDEDVMFIVLGDHLPSVVNNKGEDVLEKTKYFNTDDSLKNYIRKYSVPCLILTNYKVDLELPSVMGTDMLLTSIINNMDIEISNYYKWLYSTIDKYAGGNRYVSIDGDGNVYYTPEIDGEMKEIYNIREQIQYKFLK